MDIYQNWDVFISNMDLVPEQLDGVPLIVMTAGLKRSREDRERLGKEAAAGDKTALELFINSYVPMIVSVLKKYEPRVGYNRDVFMNCVEKLREYVGNRLFLDNLEYDTRRYVSWMATDEVTRYIASKKKIDQEIPKNSTIEELGQKPYQELIEKLYVTITDEDGRESVKRLLSVCSNDRERQLLAFRFGIEDGEPKTLQETADRFGISRERARQIEGKAVRRILGAIRRRNTLLDFD